MPSDKEKKKETAGATAIEVEDKLTKAEKLRRNRLELAQRHCKRTVSDVKDLEQRLKKLHRHDIKPGMREWSELCEAVKMTASAIGLLAEVLKCDISS